MAFSRGSIVAWSDIVSLFSALNTQRTRVGLTTRTPNSLGFYSGGTVTSTSVSQLKTSIEEMSSNKYISSSVAFTGVTVPPVGSLLNFDIFNKFRTTITNISGVCLHDNNFGNDGFNNNFGNDGFNNNFGNDGDDSFDGFDSDRSVQSDFSQRTQLVFVYNHADDLYTVDTQRN